MAEWIAAARSVHSLSSAMIWGLLCASERNQDYTKLSRISEDRFNDQIPMTKAQMTNNCMKSLLLVIGHSPLTGCLPSPSSSSKLPLWHA